jgi:hypothetical protein
MNALLPRDLLVATAVSALLLVGGGCGTKPASRPSALVPGVFTGSKPWLRTELYMGTVPASDWERFLAEEITPRFPGGFTVLDAQGQWQAPSGEIQSLPSRVLVLLHPADVASESRIESIRAAFKDRFRRISVLRSTAPATVGF